MTIPQQANSSTSVEALRTLTLPYMFCSMPRTLISTLCSFIRTQHPRFENPDGIRRHRNHGTGYARSNEIVQWRESILAVGRSIVASECTRGSGGSAVEEKKLLLDDRFKAEKNCPAACITNQVWSQSTIQALDWVLLGDQVLEDTEAIDWRFGCIPMDW